MAILNKTGITNGGTIQAEHVTRTIDALTGGSTDTIIATGSFSGSFIGTFTGTGSYATTASYALNAISAAEYMTLQLSSGILTNVTSGSTVYIGTGVTSSTATRVGAIIPFNCVIMSASFKLNAMSLVSPAALMVTNSLWSNVNSTPVLVVTGSSLDPRTLYIDGHSVSAGSTSVSAGRFINASFIPNASTTGSFVVSADILIKKV